MAENANERYERLAAEFYRETGIMAPGKDSPAATGPFDEKARWAAWANWLESPDRAAPSEHGRDGEAGT
jgi:hypothetical protein